MATEPKREPDVEWLDHVQPVGLVVAPVLLRELGLTPSRQTQADTAVLVPLVGDDSTSPTVQNAWPFFEQVLGWDARYVAGSPGGPSLPDDLFIRLPEHATTLGPTWAVEELEKDDRRWQLLVRIEPAGIDPDARNSADGWEATPHQRFERLLRETGVFAGLIVSERNQPRDGEDNYQPELRLIYAPRGETSGHLTFPLRALATVAGRPMLGGLKLLLDTVSLFTNASDRRLPSLLRKSREAQAAVSTALAEQVLGALHELLRGLDAAEPTLIRELARTRPSHLYEGLLTVLMRLVFILYAEDRDLLPSRTDGRARQIYESSYSVRGLYARLVEDAALNPDTMDERRGAWGRLLALFRLIYKGHSSHLVQARGGKLFDPNQFPFLEGCSSAADTPRALPVSDRCLLRVLEGLMTLQAKGGTRERLSYRTLDVEQIGSVYETVMGFTVETAGGRAIAIRAGKNNRTPVFVDLDKLAAAKGKDRIKFLKEEADRGQLSASIAKVLEAAKNAAELAAALDPIVDERGSPKKHQISAGTPILQPTNERRRTGSHYTPCSLTEPIVRHALEPAFERLGSEATPEQILDLKVCDPAMGSGAFLVEACRALAVRLVEAWSRHPGKKPIIPPDEDEELHARRLVAQRCLYGVDKNPLATDLAKLSLWLATLAREHEFTFLDHALKSGDSLVGLTQTQIAAAHWDTSKPGLPLFRQLVKDRVAEAMRGRAEIQAAPDETARAIQEARHFSVEARLEEVRLIGDAVIAAFFGHEKRTGRGKMRADEAPKTRDEKRTALESWLQASPPKWDDLRTMAVTLRHGAHPLTPFHWNIEFPEVFARRNLGFDAIVGNPPFAGKNAIGASNGSYYLPWLQTVHAGAHGNSDLVAHFFRRGFELLRGGGVMGLIATNTVGQGDTRETGLVAIIEAGGGILRALAFAGIEVGSDGFLFSRSSTSNALEIGEVLRLDPKYAKFIRPYIGTDEVNSDPAHRHDRLVMDLGTIPLKRSAETGWGTATLEEKRHWLSSGIVPSDYDGEVVSDYPKLMSILNEAVKGKRGSYSTSHWWQFERSRPEMRRALERLDHTFVVSRSASPHLAIARVIADQVLAKTLCILAFSNFAPFATLQSRTHEIWARFFASSMKDDLRYTPSDCFETFPFPKVFASSVQLEGAGRAYHDHRAALMIARNEGMTKTYNRFHDSAETHEDILRLRELHATMDCAVLEAYGWHDLAERAAPAFLDETNEDDHTYQGRLFWPSDFRDEVLARLLALNAERHAEEARLGVAPGKKGKAEGESDDDVDLE
jgi:hypothetical protein